MAPKLNLTIGPDADNKNLILEIRGGEGPKVIPINDKTPQVLMDYISAAFESNKSAVTSGGSSSTRPPGTVVHAVGAPPKKGA